MLNRGCSWHILKNNLTISVVNSVKTCMNFDVLALSCVVLVQLQVKRKYFPVTFIYSLVFLAFLCKNPWILNQHIIIIKWFYH